MPEQVQEAQEPGSVTPGHAVVGVAALTRRAAAKRAAVTGVQIGRPP